MKACPQQKPVIPAGELMAARTKAADDIILILRRFAQTAGTPARRKACVEMESVITALRTRWLSNKPANARTGAERRAL